MAREVRFCWRVTWRRSAGVSFPPLAARSVFTSLWIAASRFSRFAVSFGVSWPLFTPCAIRFCLFRCRWLMVGFAVWENAGTASAARTAAKNACFANFIEIILRLFGLLAAFIRELL